MPRIAILGAGVAGLAAAHRLEELSREGSGVEYDVYESSTRAGGCISTIVADGAVLELGADSLLVGKPAIASLLERLDLHGEVVDQQAQFRGALILFGGRLRALPAGFRLFAPRSIPALVRSGLFSPGGMLRAAMEPLVPARRSLDDESVASFVTRRFGGEVLARLAQPLIGGIYSADPARLSMHMALPEFVRYERESGSVLRAMQSASRAASPRLASLRGGLQRLVDALVDRVRPAVHVSHAVERAERAGNRWRIVTAAGVREADAVISALPASAAASAFAADARLAAVLGSMRTTTIATVNVLYDAAQVRLPAATGFIIPNIENRRIAAATFSSQKYAQRTDAGTVAVRAFVGGAFGQAHLTGTDGDVAAVAVDELRELMGVAGRPRETLVTRWHNLPQYDVGHEQTLAKLDEATTRVPGLAFAGCALRGVGVPDCVAGGEAAAESVFGYVVGAKGVHT